jgi:hypothetical protein
MVASWKVGMNSMVMRYCKISNIVFLLCFAFACGNDSEPTPPRAASGTIVMKLNGSELPRSTTLNPSVTLKSSTGEITVQGWFEDVATKKTAGVSIYLFDGDKVGQFEIKGDLDPSELEDEHNIFYSIDSGQDIYYSWQGKNPMAGKVTITKLDLTKNLISGTFEAKLYNDASKLADLTEGAFTDLAIHVVK